VGRRRDTVILPDGPKKQRGLEESGEKTSWCRGQNNRMEDVEPGELIPMKKSRKSAERKGSINGEKQCGISAWTRVRRSKEVGSRGMSKLEQSRTCITEKKKNEVEKKREAGKGIAAGNLSGRRSKFDNIKAPSGEKGRREGRATGAWLTTRLKGIGNAVS